MRPKRHGLTGLHGLLDGPAGDDLVDLLHKSDDLLERQDPPANHCCSHHDAHGDSAHHDRSASHDRNTTDHIDDGFVTRWARDGNRRIGKLTIVKVATTMFIRTVVTMSTVHMVVLATVCLAVCTANKVPLHDRQCSSHGIGVSETPDAKPISRPALAELVEFQLPHATAHRPHHPVERRKILDLLG